MAASELEAVLQATELVQQGQCGLTCRDDIDRRIQELLRVKSLSRALTPARELRFYDALEMARVAAASPNASERARALRALDTLGLELCDD